MLRIPVKTASQLYQAVLEPGVISRAGNILREVLGETRPVFVVSTSPVHRRWGKRLLESLEQAGFTPKLVEMPDGERFKRLRTVETLAEKLVRLGADRKAVIIAFGGGVVGDAAGLLASMYMRGIGLVQVPTTVQAQLDAAIGGKTGVNLRAGKNLLGTFYQPQLVLIDPGLLETLSERQFRAGMYEALKCGIIGCRDLFARLENSSLRGLRENSELLTWTIAESVRLKAQVVAADEREGDLRRILNLGHTIGHALEAATSYRHFLHGEAVAWGLEAAARISLDMGMCDAVVYQRICQAVHAWGKLPAVRINASKALPYLQSDKKTQSGVVHLVLPKEIGKVEIRQDVPQAVIMAALAEIKRASHA